MLKGQVIFVFVSNGVIAAAGLLALPILARLLDKEEMGQLLVVLAIVGVMQVFDGVRPVLVWSLNQKTVAYNQALDSAFGVVLVSIGVAAVAGVLIYLLKQELGLQLFGYVAAFAFMSYMSILRGLLEVRNQVNFVSFMRMTGWTVVYATFILLAFLDADISYYPAAIALSYILQSTAFRLKLKSSEIGFSVARVITGIGNSSFYVIAKKTVAIVKGQAIAVVVLTLDKFSIPIILGYSMFAGYGIQADLATKTYTVNSSLRQVLYPYFSRSENRNLLYSATHIVSVLFMVALATVVTIGFYSSEIIGLYAGEKYVESSKLFSTLLFVFPANILGAFGVLKLQVLGRFEEQYKISLLAAAATIPVFLLLTAQHGLEGAAVGLIVTRIVDLLTFFRSIHRKSSRWIDFCFAIFVLSYLTLAWYVLLGEVNFITPLLLTSALSLWLCTREQPRP